MGCFNAGGTADIIEIVRPGIRKQSIPGLFDVKIMSIYAYSVSSRRYAFSPDIFRSLYMGKLKAGKECAVYVR